MLNFIKSFLPHAVQDIVTALVTFLAAHGYITADQTQATIGSLFFLVMVVANYFVAQSRKAKAAQAGGMAVAAQSADIPTSAPVVAQIIANAKVVK